VNTNVFRFLVCLDEEIEPTAGNLCHPISTKLKNMVVQWEALAGLEISMFTNTWYRCLQKNPVSSVKSTTFGTRKWSRDFNV